MGEEIRSLLWKFEFRKNEGMKIEGTLRGFSVLESITMAEDDQR